MDVESLAKTSEIVPQSPPTYEDSFYEVLILELQHLMLAEGLQQQQTLSSPSSPASSSSSAPLEIATRNPTPNPGETRIPVPPSRLQFPPAITTPWMSEREPAFRAMLAWTFDVANAQPPSIGAPSMGPRDEEGLVSSARLGDGSADWARAIMGPDFQNSNVEVEESEEDEYERVGGSFEHVEHVERVEHTGDIEHIEDVEDVGNAGLVLNAEPYRPRDRGTVCAN